MFSGMDDRTSVSAARVEATLSDLAGTPSALTTEALTRARARASGLLSAQTESFGLATLAGTAMSTLWLDAGWSRAQARRLIDELEAATGVPRLLIGLQAVGNPDLLSLPFAALTTIQLEALLAFGDLTSVSLWATDDDDAECLAWRGREPRHDAPRCTQAVMRWQRRHAVLVAEGAHAADAEPLLVQAAAMLG